MKKENRKIAQQRRAEERKKKALKHRISKILAICIPILIIAALIAVLAVFSGSTGTDTDEDRRTETEETDASSETSDNSGESETGYSTDSSLTVQDGDTVNIDYVGSIDGTEFSGGNTNGAGTDLVIGSGSYIDDFEDQLIGSHPGDVINVSVTFPDPYNNNPDLSGKEAIFEVTVNGIYE